MAENQELVDDSSQTHENIDQWACPICGKNISSSRPPVFNSDNCSCAEAAAYTNGNGNSSTLAQLSGYGDSMFAYDKTSHVYQHHHQQGPQSYTSSNSSVKSPEGPEREDPNTYLPLGPDIGLNEDNHRLRSSLYFEMSYPMRMFLEQDYQPSPTPYATEHTTKSRFLSQDPYIQYQSSRSGKKSSKRSKPSMRSSGSGEGSFISWGMDPHTGIGAWMDEGGNRWTEGVYPMAMSGLTEYGFDG